MSALPFRLGHAVVALCLLRGIAVAEKLPPGSDAGEKVSTETHAGVEGTNGVETAPATTRKPSKRSGKSRKVPPPELIVAPARPPGVEVAPPAPRAAPPTPPPLPARPAAAPDEPPVLVFREVPPPPPPAPPPPMALSSGVAGYLAIGLGGGNTGVVGRADVTVIPLHLRSFHVGFSLSGGLSGAGSAPGWVDGEASVQLSFEKEALGGRLVFAGGGGPGIASSRGRNCSEPLCGYVPSTPPSLVGVGYLQGGWWLVQPKGDDVGFFLNAQAMSEGVFDVTLNVAVGINDLRNFASAFY